MHADRAVHAVIDDDDDDGQIVLHGRREILAVHQEAAVAGEGDHCSIREDPLGADRGRYAIAHRAAGWRELRRELVEAMEAVHPGRVIARAIAQDGVVGELAAQPAHHLARMEFAGHGRRLLAPGDIGFMRGGAGALPGGGIRRLDRLERGAEAGRRGIDRQRRAIDPAELFRIGMDMHQRPAGIRDAEQRVGLARHLREAPADQQDEVALLDAGEQLRVRADAEIAGEVRMVGREQHLPAERDRDRQVETLGEGLEVGDRLRTPARATEDRDRRLGRGEALGEIGHLRRGRMLLGDLIGLGVGNVSKVGQHVFGQRDHDRAGTARGRDMEGAADDLRDACGIVDLGRPLGHRAEDGAVVEFLEGLALAHALVDLADEEDQRGRVLVGDMDTGRGIGGAGTARHEADAGLAGELAGGFRHHAGAALGPADGDLHRGVVQRVEHGEIALARHAEGVGGAVDQKLVDEDLPASAISHAAALPRPGRSRCRRHVRRVVGSDVLPPAARRS